METHVDEGTPLSNYLEGKGEKDEIEWQEPEQKPDYDSSPPSSPTGDFAPRGLARVRRRFRENVPQPPQVETTPAPANIFSLEEIHSHVVPLFELVRVFLETLTTSIDRQCSNGFIERLRLAIVQSQLLEQPLLLALQPAEDVTVCQLDDLRGFHGVSTSGATVAAIVGFGAAFLMRWSWRSGEISIWKRILTAAAVATMLSWLLKSYVRRESLRVIQKQGLNEANTFFPLSRDFDRANSAALNFIMEVELVARGYRLSTPIPPISRLENNGQSMKCMELRKVLRSSFTEVISKYYQIAFNVWGFAEQTAMLQLQSQYQFTVSDVVERFEQFKSNVGHSNEKLQSLKDDAYLFHDIRKVLLSGVVALQLSFNEADRAKFATVTESLKELNIVTRQAYSRVREVLAEDEILRTPVTPKTPKTPQTPSSADPLAHQMRRLNAMTMNIRNVQAKLHLLREESSKTLNEADDISDLGPMFMAQYDSIGQDLRDLMEAWQSGKASLASGINKNEKRLSSIGSIVMSPTSSMSGQTIAEGDNSPEGSEAGVEEALKKLNGDSSGDKTEPEVFEAISLPALPRPRSTFSREERIVRMKEERKQRESVRAKADAHQGMMRELRGVLNLKPAHSRMSL